MTVPARKINILSAEGDKTWRLHNILVNRVDPTGQCVTYVPITMEGNILVDKTLASCYAGNDHNLIHIGAMVS